jgi:hypothetical protein
MLDSVVGTLSCFGVVVTTNAVFVNNWWVAGRGGVGMVGFGAWLLARMV